jgi:dual specificity phosphatase 12
MPPKLIHGQTNILSLLRPRLTFDDSFAVYPLEIDDSADTDILTHLPSCVTWIHQALEKRTKSLNPSQTVEAPPMLGVTSVDKRAAEPKAGGVLVHCQAGMSRSATVVVAYLMALMELEPVEALEILRAKRPVVE